MWRVNNKLTNSMATVHNVSSYAICVTLLKFELYCSLVLNYFIVGFHTNSLKSKFQEL